MGWFFNKNNNKSDQSSSSDQHNHSDNFYNITKSYTSKKITCKNDPEDDQFLICKTIIKDNNGTHQEQERLPINAAFRNSNQNSFSHSTFGSSPFKSQIFDDQKAFDKFKSFFIQPSFFDFHNSTDNPQINNQNQQIQSYSRSYSQSKSCHTDPQDNQYLICKSKIFDGNQTKQIQQRIKASDQFRIPSFQHGFSSVGHQIDQQVHNLMKEMNHGFNFIMPFVGSVMNFVNDLENLQKGSTNFSNQTNEHYFPRQSQFSNKNQQPSSQATYFSNNTKKDTNIYDL